MRKWMPAVLIALASIASLLLLPRLPELVEPNLDALLPFSTTTGETASRWWLAFGMPAAALGVWLLFLALTTRRGFALQRRMFGRWAPAHTVEPESIARFRSTYDLVITLVIAFLLVFHLAVLGLAAGGPSWIARALALLVGLGLAVLGNVMPRTRPNPIMGVRTSRTLHDPLLWARTHRLFGGLLVAAGVVVMLVAWFAVRYALLAFIGGILVSCLIVLIVLLRTPHPRASTGAAVMFFLLFANGAEAQVPQGRPDSIPPAGVLEEERSFESDRLTLNGTLTMPAHAAAQTPIAVIVVGSGPTDRNGNGPLAQTNLYRQLAWQLATRGIASFRYDKRGIGPGSRGLDHATMVTDDFVGDVIAAARLVDADARWGDVFLLGHSEGAQLVLQAANRGAPAAGVIMASGTGRPLRDVLRDQFSLQLSPSEVARVDSAFVRFLAGDDVTGMPAVAQPLFVPFYRQLIRSMQAYDPTAEIRRADRPLLLVHGGMDLQTTQADTDGLRAAQPAAATLDIPHANHVFKSVTSLDPAAQRPSYHDPALPIVPELAEGIAGWIGKITGKR